MCRVSGGRRGSEGRYEGGTVQNNEMCDTRRQQYLYDIDGPKGYEQRWHAWAYLEGFCSAMMGNTPNRRAGNSNGSINGMVSNSSYVICNEYASSSIL
jgi:hypothetical protein